MCLAHGNELLFTKEYKKDRIVSTLSKVSTIVANSNYTRELVKKLIEDNNQIKVFYPGANDLSLIQAENLSAVFGSRFIKGSNLSGYPIKKLILNRIFNYFTKLIFLSKYNDFTNAFKIYKKDALLKAMPLVSESFNVFLEMPLKIISRKMNYRIIPIAWKNRREGKAKFNIKELRSKYLFTLIYCFLEKILLK